MNFTIDMKIKLVVSKKEKYIEIPMSIKELGNLYDIIFTVNYKWAKRNKIDLEKLSKKFGFIIHDVIYDGKVCEFENGKLKISKKKSFYKCKPKWKIRNK